jgi:SAM-dependent methyltransferase
MSTILSRTTKEVIRDMIAKLHLTKLHLKVRRWRGENVDHLFLKSLPDRFSVVYKNRVWLNGRPSGSLSGRGSDLDSTVSIRQQLPQLLRSVGTETLMDVGCGDFNWMRELQLPCKYIGIDLVPDLIACNNQRYGEPSRVFQLLDAVHDHLPPADTVLCREVLFHLSFDDIWSLIRNIRSSGCRFLIATSDNDLQHNADIVSGDFRMLNLHRGPLFFPPQIHVIRDDFLVRGRTLGAWRVAELPPGPSTR